jgi:uracil-DNA glycosylase family 4
VQGEGPRAPKLREIGEEVVTCRRCPRLVEWREEVADEKRAAFRDQRYWGRPVAGVGDPDAWLLVVGLAPAAHGANRTGRMFTGDRSGDWLYRALHRAGFCDRAESRDRDDGLALTGVWITATLRCAPPENRPAPEERTRCRPFLEREVDALDGVEVVVPLGGYAYRHVLRIFRDRGWAVPSPMPDFGHGLEMEMWREGEGGAGDASAGEGSEAGGDGRRGIGAAVAGDRRLRLVTSYHPSQQNTFTGTLTEEMFAAVWRRARELGPGS